MNSVPGMPAGFSEVESWFTRVFEPGFGRISGGLNVECAPDGARVAFTGTSLQELAGVPAKAICLLDLRTNQVQRLTEGAGNSQEPHWSPRSDRIAFLTDRGHSGLLQPCVMDPADPDRQTQFPVAGHSAEHLEWCRDGRHLLVLAAEEGAEQGAVGGSGRATAANQKEERPKWAPEVRRSGEGLGGWRRAFLLDTEDGSFRQVSPPGLNVWEGCLAGESLLAVVSNLPWEGDWAQATLALIPLDGGEPQRIHEPRWQLAWPAASPDGSRLAIVEGIASDRGLVAGEVLLVDPKTARTRKLDTAQVDVTWLRFRDVGHLCFGGHRDLDTVFGEIDLETNEVVSHPVGDRTTSGEYPSASMCPDGGLMAVTEAWQSPPAITRLRGAQLEEVASLVHPGFEGLRGQLGPMNRISWTSHDGLAISGLYTEPPGMPGPHPTVLLVHGGPAHLWTSRWPGKVGTPLLAAHLVSRGFAVLLPNPRGSSGRGQRFLEMELGDYGGAEVDDDLSGLDRLVADGIADPDRLAVMGGSHGGYMTCWLTTRTDRFKAAVAISPVTDWYSQHYSSNIPEFDSMYLGAHPTTSGGAYFERSPVFFAGRSRTPTLLTAGLQDRCTPPGQAVEFHQALLEAGVETELVLYPEEGHGVRALPTAVDQCARVVEFLGKHLLNQEAAQPEGPYSR